MACEGAREARVRFRYNGGDWDNVISRNPPVDYTFETILPSFGGRGQCSCVHYSGDVVIAQGFYYNHWTGNILFQSAGIYRVSIQFLGPLAGIRLNPQCPNNNNNRCLEIQTRGLPGAQDGTCSELKFRSVPGQSLRGNWTYDDRTLTVENIRRIDNRPDDNCGQNRCKFSVKDAMGTIYERIEDDCPAVTVDCNECPPGQSRIGNCCINCNEITQQIRDIQELVRQL
jgi:hypothetical protein